MEGGRVSNLTSSFHLQGSHNSHNHVVLVLVGVLQGHDVVAVRLDRRRGDGHHSQGRACARGCQRANVARGHVHAPRRRRVHHAPNRAVTQLSLQVGQGVLTTDVVLKVLRGPVAAQEAVD